MQLDGCIGLNRAKQCAFRVECTLLIRLNASFCALFENLLCEIVVNLGFVVEHFEIGVLE